MKYKVDVVRIRENSITLNGWALGKTPESKVTFRVEDEHHQPVKCKMVSTRRDDVSQIYFKKVIDKEFGFDIQFPYERGKSYWLLIRCDGRQAKIKYNEELITKRASVAHKRMEKIKDLMNMETVHVALDFWKENGLRALIKKSCHKIQGLDNDYDYGEWYELTKPTEEELKAQRETHFEKEPLFSVVIPVYKTPERYLKEMLDSILDQTYGNWEVCIADGSPRGQDVEKVLKKYAQKDSRIRYEILGGNRGISGNTNAALAMAKGEYVILADHDDTIPPQAFYEVAKAINKHPDCDVLYSDEDKLDMDGKALFDPHFKPDFNPDLLTSVNYICHLFVVKKSLLDQVGGFRKEFDGAQDYDFIFRCTEKAAKIVHIPKVLYHWRCHQGSTASNPESKMYAFEAGSRAVMAHYERVGIPAESVEKGVDYGIYHTHFKIQGEPLVSVIIPNKDHSQDLDTCIRSLMERSTYQNLEFIVVENNSTSPETFAYYKKLQEAHSNVKVVTWKEGFNYSAINNFGASFASGEYLLLLNNDTELLEPDSIKEMLGFCQREDVGIVGARLLYADDTIQHAGVVLGLGGIAGHVMCRASREDAGYFGRMVSVQEISAVTAACMLVDACDFRAVGGFDESFRVAFNDIDLCMKIRDMGRKIVFTPYAELYHYESKSRGLEDTPEKQYRFEKEITRFREKWEDQLKKGDPYYSPNLSVTEGDCSLRED